MDKHRSSPIDAQSRRELQSSPRRYPRQQQQVVPRASSPPRQVAFTTTTSNDIQEVEELQLQLHHLKETLKVKRGISVATDTNATTYRQELEKMKDRLRLLDIQREAEAQRSRTTEGRQKEKVDASSLAIQQLVEEEVTLKATHAQRKKTHKICVTALGDHRVKLRTAIVGSEVAQKHAICALEMTDAVNANLAGQRRERAEERTLRDSQERGDDQEEFDSMHREVHRLRTLNHQAEVSYAESQLRLATKALETTQAQLNHSTDYLEQKHLECEAASKEILGISAIQQHLRSTVAKSEALESLVAQQKVEVHALLATRDAHERQLTLGEADLQRERESEARVKELVGAVDAMREKLVIVRERRSNNRIHFKASTDRASGGLRNEVLRGNQQLVADQSNVSSSVASRQNELEMLASQVNSVTRRLNDAETRLEEVNAQYHACTLVVEVAREKDRQVRDMTRRSTVELQRALASTA